MGLRCLPLLLACAVGALRAQTVCPATPVYSPCDIVFELNDAEAAAHPNPYVSVDLHAEFRSPKHRTYLLPAFWDGGRRMAIRFSPTEAGDWDYRVSSNLQRFEGATGQFAASAVDTGASMTSAWAKWRGSGFEKPKPCKDAGWVKARGQKLLACAKTRTGT